ncbi:MAG: ABC transporter permease subunit [Thaumarchaeota archaeon]|nr:ABC transporter permease subunit [Candidatus Calditenuaceae archaeon]MDW8187064.1 ABC transporter permease subunit [Nitrososphaerota archaeon]
MSTLRAISVLTEYEMLRSFARRRVLILLSATLLLEIAIYYVLSRLPTSLISPIGPYIWTIGLVAPSTALLHMLAITIGASTSSEEYEVGTADFWFTRPISRLEYFVGKLIGGLLLLSSMVLLYSALALAISWYVFGPQSRIDVLAIGIVASVLAATPSYAIGVALGELMRRSMVAIVLGGIVFFGSVLFQSYASIVAVLNNDRTLIDLATYLPSWGSVGYTVTIVAELLDLQSLSTGLFMVMSGLGTVEVGKAQLSILLYSLAPLFVAWIKLRYTDVTRRSS